MRHATFINFIILILAAGVVFFLKNPLGLFAIMLLQPMPYGLLTGGQPDEDEDDEGYEGGKIGFLSAKKADK